MNKDDWLSGAILAVIGLYALISGDLKGGFFLIGLGIAFMASVSEDFREKFFDFIFSVFEELWKMLSRT